MRHEFLVASLAILNILQVNDGMGEYFILSVKYVEQNVPTRRSYARHDTYRVSLVSTVFEATSRELIRCIFWHRDASAFAETEIFLVGDDYERPPCLQYACTLYASKQILDEIGAELGKRQSFQVALYMPLRV